MFTLLKVRNLYTYLVLSVIGYHKQAIVSSYGTAYHVVSLDHV